MATSETVREYAKELGRLGGTARRKSLTPEQRRESARNAALARWAKKPKSETVKTRARRAKKGAA